MCLYPRLIKNRKYTKNKKNNGNIPQVKDSRVLLVPVGCGNCIECRKQKARGWQIRLQEEVKTDKRGKFITLTFSNKSIIELTNYEKQCTDWKTKTKYKQSLNGLEGYQLDNEIATVGMRLFNERWRKEYGKAIKHWLVTELGHNGTENIHMHGIVWTEQSIEDIRRIWKYGYVYPRNKEEEKKNYVNERTVNYTIKYISKKDEKHTTYKSIILTSPGIGKDYTKTHDIRSNRYNKQDTIETYRTTTGHRISMPTYWRNQIYSEEEREQLWLQRLDKQEMWVMGEKIDVSKGYEEYDKLQKYYRKINTQLGYEGDDKTEEWRNRRTYEQERRNIMQEERRKNPYGNKKVTEDTRIREQLGKETIIIKQKE